MKIEINTEFIKLDQFLKWAGIADSGATAKYFIENRDIMVNNEICTQRGKKLHKGDIIKFGDTDVFEII